MSCLSVLCLMQVSVNFSFVLVTGFIIWGFAFRSTACFELIFVYGVRYGSKFIYLHMDINCNSVDCVNSFISSLIFLIVLEVIETGILKS